MVRHSMKILAPSPLLSKKTHWSKMFFVLFEAKTILVSLRIKRGGKSFVIHMPPLKRLFFIVLKLLIVQPAFHIVQ